MMHFEFTDRAKKVLQLANQEAQRAGHDYVGPEHILLGLLSEASGVGALVLKNLGINLSSARREVEQLTRSTRKSGKQGNQQLPMLPSARSVLERARQESASLSSQYVGTEHVLLGLLHDEDNVAVQTMWNLGLNFQAARDEVVKLMGGAESSSDMSCEPSGPAARIGIVGVSGYGGGEVLRLCAGHPYFEVVHIAAGSSAGQKLGGRFPGLPSKLAEMSISTWNPTDLPQLDVLFASLPTGESRDALARVSPQTKIIDIGGDHRFVEGWSYGLADIWPDEIRKSMRIANPGCYPAAAITALAPLLHHKLIDASGIVIDAKSGISGAGRGGGSTFGFAEVNEDLVAYGLLKHAHVPEMTKALSQIAGSDTSITFTPHLIPVTRGLLATCYARGTATTQQCIDFARSFYRDRAFVRVVDLPPHTKWATGTNLAFVSYACDPQRGTVIAMCAIDNLGKGAAGQAVQNANLMLNLPEEAGLSSAGLWP